MFSSSKPHSAITVLIDRLTSESYEMEDLSGIPELIEVIDLQKATGPTEAARALRKKLKYGNVLRQLRALILLNGILENGTPRIQRNLFDEMLLERLRVCAASEVSDEKVKRLCRNLFISWAKNYEGQQGMQNVVALHKELPRRKQLPNKENARKELVDPFKGEENEEQQQLPKVSVGTKTQETHGHRSRPSSSGIKSSFFGSSDVSRSKDKNKVKSEPASAMQMSTAAGEGLTASAILQNMLRSHNREEQRISENESIAKQYKHCWNIRRRVLRYIGASPNAEIMGALLDSHDKLIEAILNYKHLDQALDDDSDSEDELAEQQHMFRMAEERAAKEKGKEKSVDSPVGGPSPPVAPPRPAPQAAQAEIEEEEDDNDNPFADSNRIETPSAERPEPRW